MRTSCNHTEKENESKSIEQTTYTTKVPQNPFLYQNNSQPIIHFNSAHTDAIIHGMPECEMSIETDQISFIPASIAINYNI